MGDPGYHAGGDNRPARPVALMIGRHPAAGEILLCRERARRQAFSAAVNDQFTLTAEQRRKALARRAH